MVSEPEGSASPLMFACTGTSVTGPGGAAALRAAHHHRGGLDVTPPVSLNHGGVAVGDEGPEHEPEDGSQAERRHVAQRDCVPCSGCNVYPPIAWHASMQNACGIQHNLANVNSGVGKESMKYSLADENVSQPSPLTQTGSPAAP
jgi:hypothetical protein